MASFVDVAFLAGFAGVALLFGGNCFTGEFVKSWRKKGVDAFTYVLAVFIATVGLLLSVLFWISVNEMANYEPPKPINLVFWGVDKEQYNNYNELNEYINLTNSRVVLFGDALNDEAPIDNVISTAPNIRNQFEAVRTWYYYNKNDARNWHSVVVFGVDVKVSNDSYANWIAKPTAESYFTAKQIYERGFKGSFEHDPRKGVICDFETKNSIKTSGRRPLTKPSKEWRGL